MRLRQFEVTFEEISYIFSDCCIESRLRKHIEPGYKSAVLLATRETAATRRGESSCVQCIWGHPQETDGRTEGLCMCRERKEEIKDYSLDTG